MARSQLRSEDWWNIPGDPGMTALYLERFLNWGLTPGELQSGRPVIGIAQSGSDLTPCNRAHLQSVERIRDGVRDAGGVPLVFPMHPIQESCRRPTAALDRNLAYLGLVEILHGYPLDGVVFTTGCDKTTPAALMAAATTDLPSILFSCGPMLNSTIDGRRVGSGAIIWEARRRLASGEIDATRFTELVCASAPSPGFCNTMGTAMSMNCLAEALGMALSGSAAIPAPFRERGQAAYATGRRAVEIVREDLKPSRILTRQAFLNAIVVATAIGGSTNCPPHLIAVARHASVSLTDTDWERHGYEVPLLVNCIPAGEYLAEDFHRAGGLPVVMRELLRSDRIDGTTTTITGQDWNSELAAVPEPDGDIIRCNDRPLRENAGFLVLKGNLFQSGLMKTSVISAAFRQRYLERPGAEGRFECRAVVFDGPEDYHARIDDPSLEITEESLLVIRGCGPIGFPGAAEVVNMQPPGAMIARGVAQLPTLGDGRQSGTSECPSILNAAPESCVGGRLDLLETGDTICVDLNTRQVNAVVSEEEFNHRLIARGSAKIPPSATPWQELFRGHVGQLDTGACLDFATGYRSVCSRTPRHNH